MKRTKRGRADRGRAAAVRCGGKVTALEKRAKESGLFVFGQVGAVEFIAIATGRPVLTWNRATGTWRTPTGKRGTARGPFDALGFAVAEAKTLALDCMQETRSVA